MTDKQTLFCQEYIKDCNASAAYIRTGYTGINADVLSDKMMKIPEVTAKIEELMANRSERTAITADYVLNRLYDVAEKCMSDWADPSGACRSLELLGKHLGVFEKDNSQKKPDGASMDNSQFKELREMLNARTKTDTGK